MNLIDAVREKSRIRFTSAVILTLLLVYVPFQLIFYNVGLGANFIENIGTASYVLIVIAISFLTFYLKKGSNVRKFMFIALAIVMAASFMTGFFIERGHIGIVQSDVDRGLPFCHIALLNNLLSVPFLKEFVSTSSLGREKYGVYSMAIIWLWSTILIGKGWCSWGCFYGGWDTLFGSFGKKPLIKLSERNAKKLRIIPITLLVLIPVLSLILLEPVWCRYVCPFKTTTEFYQVTAVKTFILIVVSVGLFVGVIGVLSAVFGKRVWCTYGCPFGAFQGFLGKAIRPFSLKIDAGKCIKCGKCANVCQNDGINKELIEKGKFSYNCSLCTACINECPKGAISMRAFGVNTSPKPLLEKIFSFIKDGNTAGKVKNYVIGIFDDILNPQSFFMFFGLTVLFTFFSGFYLDLFRFAVYFMGGK